MMGHPLGRLGREVDACCGDQADQLFVRMQLAAGRLCSALI
jgi:hypothetical protein